MAPIEPDPQRVRRLLAMLSARLDGDHETYDRLIAEELNHGLRDALDESLGFAHALLLVSASGTRRTPQAILEMLDAEAAMGQDDPDP